MIYALVAQAKNIKNVVDNIILKKIKNNTFARNSLILFSGTMLANILNYAFHLVIGRMVSVEIYGEVQSLTSLINIVSVPAMTLTMVATKYAAGFKAENDKFKSKIVLNYLKRKIAKFLWPVLVIVVLATPLISKFLKIDSNLPLFFIWLMMFISFFLAINIGTLNGWQKFKNSSLVGALGAIVKLFFGIILVKVGFALNGIVGSFVLAGIASYIASVVALKFILQAKNNSKNNHNDEFEKIDFFAIRKYIIPVFVGNLAINILSNIDMVLAKHNLDATTAGEYGALTIVSKIIFFVTGIIATVLFAMSAEDDHKKNNSMQIFKNASYLMLAVSMIAIIAYFVAPKLILYILFGNKYVEVAHYLGWFAIMVTLFSFANLIFQYLLSIHRTKIVYSLLAISIITAVMILFFGKSFYAIILIVSLAQVASILTGFYFLFQKKQGV